MLKLDTDMIMVGLLQISSGRTQREKMAFCLGDKASFPDLSLVRRKKNKKNKKLFSQFSHTFYFSMSPIFNYSTFLSVIPTYIGPKLHICNVFYWKAYICYTNLTWKNFLQPHLKAKVFCWVFQVSFLSMCQETDTAVSANLTTVSKIHTSAHDFSLLNA